MKINEIIVENKSQGKLRKSSSNALPNLETWHQLDNNNCPYLAYRFGVALAPSPDTSALPKKGPMGSNFTTIGYTEADDEILAGAAKAMGVTPSKESDNDSYELDSVNKTSPVKARGPVQLKKKK